MLDKMTLTDREIEAVRKENGIVPKRPGKQAKIRKNNKWNGYGTPFKKGNEVGKATRFAKGHKALGGRPKGIKGYKRPDITGSGNKRWMGENATPGSIKAWVARKLGKPSKCVNTKDHNRYDKPKKLGWISKNGKINRDLTNYIEMCPKCAGAYKRNLNGKNKRNRNYKMA